ncbi:MAG: putative DNA-binding domain-containing protein [Glaciecola sp.]
MPKQPNKPENKAYQTQILDEVFRQGEQNPTVLPALSVYKNNYIESAIRALSISYPTVLAILEENNFRKLASLYIQNMPKTCFDWADYGASLSEFIFDVEALESMPFLPEIAQLDWLLMHAERAADKPFDAASFERLQTQTPERLRFVAAPGLQVIKALFPVLEIYEGVHNPSITQYADKKHAHTVHTNNLINIAIKRAEYRSIVVWREQYKARFEYSDDSAVEAFEKLLAEHSIADVLASFGEDQTAMSTWLQSHIASRKIYAVVPITNKA